MGKAKKKPDKKEVAPTHLTLEEQAGAGKAGTGGEGGNGGEKPKAFKITKVGISPSRKVNLGNYSSVELSAFIEVVFDEPVDPDSEVVAEAFNSMRETARKEFLKQFAPYRKQFKDNKEK